MKSDFNIRHLKTTIDPNRWYVIRTMFRHELKVASKLQNFDIETYVPLNLKIKKYKSKLKKYQVPLINNYVFLKTDNRNYNNILNTKGVLGFIKNSEGLSCIPEREIDYLKIITSEAHNIENIDYENYHLLGKEIYIIDGPMVGMIAKVVEIMNSKNLVVQFENIGIVIQFNIENLNFKVLDKKVI